MSITTNPVDMREIVAGAVDLLTETRALETLFADVELFGGSGGFDGAIAKTEALLQRLVDAKTNYGP